MLSCLKASLKLWWCESFALLATDYTCLTVFSWIRLQIETEKLFIDLSGILSAALQWEERAKDILARRAQISEFEDVIRFLVCLAVVFDCPSISVQIVEFCSLLPFLVDCWV